MPGGAFRFGTPRQYAVQHLAFAAMAERFFDGEARRFGGAPDPARDGKGGEGAAGRGAAGDVVEQVLGPHVRIARRVEAVQEPGVHLGVPLADAVVRIAEPQVQGDAVAHGHPVRPGQQGRIGRAQGFGFVRQFGPTGQGLAQVVPA